VRAPARARLRDRPGERRRTAARSRGSARSLGSRVDAPSRRRLMFRQLGRLALTRSRSVLGASGLVLAVAIAALLYGGALSGGATRGIESDNAQRLLESELAFPGESSFLVLF